MEIPSGYEVSSLFPRPFDLVARIDPNGNFAVFLIKFEKFKI